MQTPVRTEVLDYRPLQQGLRHAKSTESPTVLAVLDYRPLQQGLRRATRHTCSRSMRVLDYRPLQQGLRPICLADIALWRICTRLSSTTTRIKTILPFADLVAFIIVLDYRPLQQGLRLVITAHRQLTHVY